MSPVRGRAPRSPRSTAVSAPTRFAPARTAGGSPLGSSATRRRCATGRSRFGPRPLALCTSADALRFRGFTTRVLTDARLNRRFVGDWAPSTESMRHQRTQQWRRCSEDAVPSLAERLRQGVMMAWSSGSTRVIRRRVPVYPRGAERTVRVSYAALLRVREDDRYVLFATGSRPGAFTPPGGVFKYFAPGADLLEGLGFEADRRIERGDGMRADLRGLLPERSVPEFRRWFASGAYREDAVECLQRELVEELTEVSFPELADAVPATRFSHLRTIVEGPSPVPGRPYRQLRRFEFYDLVCANQAAASLRERLLELADAPDVSTVISATSSDIGQGRCGKALIAPHSAYLAGEQRTWPDIPAVR
ncbi:hypothetical protein ABZ863_18725 [Saccharomonospora sp. NPDC046836]|uniref:SMODS-associated NUDIX domain-containing protein n=1 Tax=Saccharomonospora sp. NPDC046836 TaxID=3156921 RepID=UPI0033F7F058